MLVIRSTTLDPFWNLAVEEYLLDHVGEMGPSVFFWQSDHAVIIGKHQNPWQELDGRALAGEGGRLARRLTGGGAVYHDRGNLNYSFFRPRAEYSEAGSFDRVLRALRMLGVPAERMGRTSLGVGGRKLSGNAFCFRRESALHHGTLLVASDLDRLERYLRPPARRVRSRAIQSIPAPVTNLSAVRPGVTVEQVIDALAQSVRSEGGSAPSYRKTDGLPADAIRPIYERYRSWDWIFGESPGFEVELEIPWEGGSWTLGLDVHNGRVARCRWGTAAAGIPAEALGEALTGQRFHSPDLAKAIRTVAVCGYLHLEDLALWFEDQVF
jgi:lipoate-protein ligase A